MLTHHCLPATPEWQQLRAMQGIRRNRGIGTISTALPDTALPSTTELHFPPHHWCIVLYTRCRTSTHPEPASHNGNMQPMPPSVPGLLLGGHPQQQNQSRAFSRNPRLVSSLFQRIVPPKSIFMKMYLQTNKHHQCFQILGYKLIP